MSLEKILDDIRQANQRHAANASEPIATQEILPLLEDLARALAEDEEDEEDDAKQPVMLELPFLLVSGTREVLEYLSMHAGEAITFQLDHLFRQWGMDPVGAQKEIFQGILALFRANVATPALYSVYTGLTGYLTGKTPEEVMAAVQVTNPIVQAGDAKAN